MKPDATPQSDPIRRWRRRLLDWILTLVFLLLVVLAVQWWQARPLASGAAPPLSGLLLDGRAFDLETQAGDVMLVHFWGTWCPKCVLTNAGIDALAKTHAVITVALDSGDAETLRTYLRDHALGFETLTDEDGRIARDWGVRGVPTSFVLDAQGQVCFATVGPSLAWGLRARLWLARQMPRFCV